MRIWPFTQKTETRSDEFQQYFANLIDDSRVGDSDVLKHPIVNRGVQLISSLAGTLPINVMKDGGIAGREVDLHHPWQHRLNVRPTGTCNRSTWMETLITDAIVHGNAYNLITEDRLTWLDPKTVTPKIVNGELVYQIVINAEPRTVSQDQMLHIRSKCRNTIDGVSLAEALTDAMASGLQMYKHIRRYFENGTFSNLVWTLPPHVSKSEELAQKYANRIEAKHNGSNAFKNIFLSSDANVTSMSANNQTAQTRELLEFDIIVVAAALGLPPSALGANQNTSFSSLEIEDKKYLRDINPYLIQIEQELTSKLLNEQDILSGQRWIEMNRKAAVEMDSESELKLLTDGLQSGIYSKEFVRRKLNAPINDIDSETYFFPTNYTMYVAGESEAEVEAEPVEAVKEPEPAQKPKQDARLEEITRQTLKRLVNRIAASNKRAIEHQDIWKENLGMFDGSDEILHELGKLIDGATESRKTIAENIDIDIWITQLLKSDS